MSMGVRHAPSRTTGHRKPGRGSASFVSAKGRATGGGSRGALAALLVTSALVPLPLSAQEVLPSGGQFTSGSGTITQSGSSLNVTQSSAAGIINWNGFSIGQGSSAHFDNGSGATLNRVTGNIQSRIDGALTATGSLYLVNPAGVVVGTGGMVATGGSFAASTHDVTDADFLDGGGLTFKGTSRAGVLNAGTISSAQGDVALIARSVINTGTVVAPNGTAGLAAGYEILMKDATDADGLLSVKIGGGDTEAVNSGAIEAANAEIRANGGNVYALAGNTDSVIKASGVSHTGGRIFLTAGETGQVKVTGRLQARRSVASAPPPVPGANPAREGGNITITAGDVDISGTIDASAEGVGTNGGTVMALAAQSMTFSGRIEANGGRGGEGGFVETSGKTISVADTARVSTLAQEGRAGTWLIDPADLTIAASGGDMTGATVSANLALGNVTLDSDTGLSGTNGDIFINDGISWSSDTTLTLDAVRNIEINADIAGSGANAGLAMIYGGSYSFDNASVTLSGASAALSLNGTAYTLIHSASQLQNMNLDMAGHYALAQAIDASAFVGFVPVGTGVNPFTGTLAGLGNEISNLTINGGGGTYKGLLGSANGATVRDIGLVNATVTGGAYVGALAGFARGGTTFTNVHASGSVTALSGYTGMLVGSLYGGSITHSHSSGLVTALNMAGNAGGLVGQISSTSVLDNVFSTASVRGNENLGGLVGVSSGAISNAYAMGSVTGVASGGQAAQNIGALVGGQSGGSITSSYATGYLTGANDIGGLVGVNPSNVTNSYWDAETTGTPTDTGGTAATTEELQGTLPAGFDPDVWGIGAGLYPYLRWQFDTTPVAVSGNAYSDAGTTALAGADVSAISGGALVGSAGTGANGYYYILLPSGSIGAAGALAYLDGESTQGAAFGDAVTATGVSGLDIYGSALNLVAGGSTLGSTLVNLNTTLGAYSDTGINFFNPLSTKVTYDGYGLYLQADQAYALNGSLTSGGLLSLGGSGTYSVSGNRALTADGDLTLAAAFAWSDTSALTLGTINGGDIQLDAGITAANGSLTISGSGSVATGTNGTVDIGIFDLVAGDWRQLGAALPAFAATDFRLDPVEATFLRALGGDGSPGTPYRIADLYGLQGMASETLLNNDFVLENDIDASGTTAWNGGAGFLAIGTDGVDFINAFAGFTGSFDGQAHTITGLYIDRATASLVGLFGATSNGSTISNLTLAGGSITGFGQVGAVVGSSGSTVTNVHSSATVNSTTGGGSIGGLVGSNNGAISGSSATGAVTGTGAVSSIGGLVGDSSGTIDLSYATGTVTTGGALNANFDAGGLVGVSFGTISRSFATGDVSTLGNAAGGLAGSNYGTVENSYATGNVSAYTYAGGLVGIQNFDGPIANSYSSGTVVATDGTAGGFVGLVGFGAENTFQNNFWNTETSGESDPAGFNFVATLPGVSGLTTAGMQTLATFTGAGWDIDGEGGTGAVWRIYEGHTSPLLRAFMTGVTVTVDDKSKTYDGTAYTGFTYTASDPGAVFDGTLGSDLTSSDAGTYTIANGLYSGQFGYDIAVNTGTLTIDPRTITVTADAVSRAYGDTNPTFTFGYSGLVAGDDGSVFSGALSTAADETTGVGSYAIGQGTLSAGGNYAIGYTGANLTVDARAITVRAADIQRTEGDPNPALTWMITGGNLVNGDALNGALATAADIDSPAGVYAIEQGTLGASANYALTFVPGSLTVNTAPTSPGHPTSPQIFESDAPLFVRPDGIGGPEFGLCEVGVVGSSEARVVYPCNRLYGTWLSASAQ
jgi:filamentous hemagglutinin family protein